MNLHETNQTKQWLIDAFLELLEQYSYNDITIERITKKAGLGRRTFYRHFQTKDELVEYITTLLMHEYSRTLLENNAQGLEMAAQCYFTFWENYIDLLLLLKKAKLLHFISDNMEQLIMNVAIEIKHIPAQPDSAAAQSNDTAASPGAEDIALSEETIALYQKYRYEFVFKLAGFWQVTLLWCEENPRKSPEEMGRIISSFLSPEVKC